VNNFGHMPLKRSLKGAAVSLAIVAALPQSPVQADPVTDGRGDVTVIAVIDDAYNPYHLDFLGSRMPQHTDSDPSNDLPLNVPPQDWIPGYQSHVPPTALPVTLPSPASNPNTLRTADASVWSQVRSGTPYWLPGTKIVTAITFGSGQIVGTSGAHGAGTSSVSAGNIFGSCPECVVVFVQYDSQATAQSAVRWATRQPWIDVITNSWGFSTAVRDNITWYSDPGVTKAAAERGQSIFWSAGNGQANAFDAPVTTTHSSDKGPDWIIHVGAISPSGSSYSGAGKPVDVAGVGSSYPASYGAVNATNGGTFSGTSNATPTLAGTFARSLYLARRALAGPSKTQDSLVIATGEPMACGSARPDCELGDGVLTSIELRNALFAASKRTAQGMNVAGVGNAPVSDEIEFANEGYGSWFVRAQRGRDDLWLAEFDRLWLPLIGEAQFDARATGEKDWFIVDSYCRQQLWGDWTLGEFVRGETSLPGTDTAYPVRSGLQQACEVHPKLPPNRNLP
jgi:hypothetical protein